MPANDQVEPKMLLWEKSGAWLCHDQCRAYLAWYEALADQGELTAALKACYVAARTVRQSHWRGELLDGAAFAAQELGRPDLGKRLEAAWRAAPTMTRLLRWLAVAGDEYERIRLRAARALARCPKAAARQIGMLRVLVGDVTEAAAVLAKSPGLGWSNPDQPGHTVFPLLAMLLSSGTIGGALVAELEATGRSVGAPRDDGRGAQASRMRPRSARPSS